MTERPIEKTQELIQTLMLRLCLSDDDLTDPKFPVQGEPGEEDTDGVEFFLSELESLMEDMDEAIDNWLKNRISNTDFLDLEFLLKDTLSAAEDVVFSDDTYGKQYDSVIRAIKETFAWVREQSANTVRKDFYVYAHISASDGQVFYIGKGTENRAWSQDRQPSWHAHVKKIGDFVVEILESELSEIEALDREDHYIKKHSSTVLNQQRPIDVTLTFDLSGL